MAALLILIYFGKKDRLIFRFPGTSFLIRIISFLAAASNTFSFTRSTDSVVCCYLLTLKTLGPHYLCLGHLEQKIYVGKHGKFYAFPFGITYIYMVIKIIDIEKILIVSIWVVNES